MSSPRSVREVQKLSGRIASLFPSLYPGQRIIVIHFFKFLGRPRSLGGMLSTDKEEGSDQRPVYYVSHALRGPELRYNEVEKIALALVMTAQKLRPYFLSYQIIVLTNSILGRIMTHSEVFGRMIKWTVELGEYDIVYKPRVSIKAQALSDFFSEMVQPDEEEIKGVYEAKDDRMLKYLKLIQAQAEVFVDWSIEQIPCDENEETDALAKMAASLSEVNTQNVLHVSQLILSTEKETLPAPEDSWMTPLIQFVVHNELPEDKDQSQKIKRQAPSCPSSEEIFVGGCGLFFKMGRGRAPGKNTEKEVLKFSWKNIVCRFGIPRRLISDNGRQFQGKEITTWCREMKITQSFTSIAYSQANGQTEVVNRIIVQALKTRLQGKVKDWVEELPNVLWAYRLPKHLLKKLLLIWCMVLKQFSRLKQSSARVESYSDDNTQRWEMELDLVEEKREQALIQMKAYRGRVMK
ncbi:uncharacterized protein LOC142532363 [Primulina tabacum]|uniref:uncharacterized protein LOC142532363 n=1 Tax=Primulina tabacum TaxID=48773 RepID=UPI003F598D15